MVLLIMLFNGVACQAPCGVIQWWHKMVLHVLDTIIAFFYAFKLMVLFMVFHHLLWCGIPPHF
jgi:hypothetical protein